MNHRPRDLSNLESLERYWRRSPFHDESIEEINALNKRAVIRLARLTLIITDVTRLERCELPAIWLSESVRREGDRITLDIETDNGRLKVTGTDVRLIRNSDLAILIPPIDV